MKKFTSILLVLAMLMGISVLSVSAVPPEPEYVHVEGHSVCELAAQPESVNALCPHCGSNDTYRMCGGDTTGMEDTDPHQGKRNGVTITCHPTEYWASTVIFCGSCHNSISVSGSHRCYTAHECDRGQVIHCPTVW